MAIAEISQTGAYLNKHILGMGLLWGEKYNVDTLLLLIDRLVSDTTVKFTMRDVEIWKENVEYVLLCQKYPDLPEIDLEKLRRFQGLSKMSPIHTKQLHFTQYSFKS